MQFKMLERRQHLSKQKIHRRETYGKNLSHIERYTKVRWMCNRAKRSQWWAVSARIWVLHCISRFNCHRTVIECYLNFLSIPIQTWFRAFLSQKIRFITVIGTYLLTTRTCHEALSHATLALTVLPSVASGKKNIHQYGQRSWFYPHNMWFSQKYRLCYHFWMQFQMSGTGSRKSKRNIDLLKLAVPNECLMRRINTREKTSNDDFQFSSEKFLAPRVELGSRGLTWVTPKRGFGPSEGISAPSL
jgi:hypothetical protein